MLIDSHAHIDDPRFNDDRDAVLQRAWDAGVRKILTIGNGAVRMRWDAASRSLKRTIGSTPAPASIRMTQASEERHYALLKELSRHPRVIAIGEAGLDYHYDHSPRDTPTGGLPCSGRCCQGTGFADHRPYPGCGSGHPADPRAGGAPPRGSSLLHLERWTRDFALGIGFFISFSGIVTFPTARTLARRRGGFLPSGFWWKRIVRISPLYHIGEDVMSQALSQTRCDSWHSCVKPRRKNWRRRPPPISTDCLRAKQRKMHCLYAI